MGSSNSRYDLEKQTKRNIIRKIDDIADYLMKCFSSDGEHLDVTYENTEQVASGILSEIFGVNTANLHEPVDEEICQTVDDILSQIREKRIKTVPHERVKEDPLKDIRKMADEIMAGPTSRDKADPFEAAMSILEKK